MNTKLKRRAVWTLLTAFSYYTFYMGFYENREFSKNFFLFWVWFSLACSMLNLHPAVREGLNRMGRTVPSWLSGLSSAVLVANLAGFGWFVTAAGLSVAAILSDLAYEPKSK